MNETIQVDYKTEDGTASSEGDYIEAIGTLTFGPGEKEKHVTLEVLDDDVFEEDEHFYIRISNLRRKDGRNFKEIEVESDDGKKSMQVCDPSGAWVEGEFESETKSLGLSSVEATSALRMASIGVRRGSPPCPGCIMRVRMGQARKGAAKSLRV